MVAALQPFVACSVFALMRLLLSATMSLGISERGLAAFHAPFLYNILMIILNSVKSFLAAIVAVLCCRIIGDISFSTTSTLTIFAFLIGLIRIALGIEEALLPKISFVAALISTSMTYAAIALGSRLALV